MKKLDSDISFILLAVILINFAIVFVGSEFNNPIREEAFATKFSCFELLISAYLSLNVFLLRNKNNNLVSLKTSHIIWLIIAIGFIYLACDEIGEWHERIDAFTHIYFHIQETALTDSLDDLIIGLYFITGLCFLYAYKKELYLYFRETWNLFIVGFILTVFYIVFDALTNRYDFLPFLFGDNSTTKTMFLNITFLEDKIKIFAEGIFIAGFYWCKQISYKLSV